VSSIEIAEVSFAEVARLRGRAERDRVAVKDAAGARWWAARVDGQVVAVAGLLVRPGWARLKSAWTAPEYRGRGIGRRLFEVRLAWCLHNLVPRVEVISARPAMYEAAGFRFKAWHQSGFKVLERRL
jgi:GNAT superfamily N-acetyltransferase